MRTKVAPSFAITYMGHFEDTHVFTYRLRPLMYIRYIDDIFMIWPHGAVELTLFFQHLNNCSAHIKFTTETSPTEISFLDSKVVLEDGVIYTDLFTKPTDSHNYLYYNSAHPQRCKDSIPYSQFLRVRRICTRNQDFDKNVIELSKHFLRRKYPLELLLKAATLARNLNRTTLLAPPDVIVENETTEEKVFLITTFHPHDRVIADITWKNWQILGRNQTTENLHARKLTCGYRRPKNLRDALCKARVKRLPGDEKTDPQHVAQQVPTLPDNPVTTPQGHTGRTYRQTTLTNYVSQSATTTNIAAPNSNISTPDIPTRIPKPSNPHTGKRRGFPYCNRKDCRYCPLLNKTGQIKSTTTGLNHTTMMKISCRSSNLVYAITCKTCGKQYVGQTLLRLKDRFVHQLRDITIESQDKPVGKHFSQANHRGIDDLQINILEFIKMPPRSPQAIPIRLRAEKSWTHTLRTLAPQGLNLENPKEYTSHQTK